EIIAVVGLVALARVCPERAGLDDLRAEEHVGELEAATDDSAVAKHSADLLGSGAGGDVEVLGLAAQVEVAHATSHEEGLVSGCEQLADDLERVVVDIPERQ